MREAVWDILIMPSAHRRLPARTRWRLMWMQSVTAHCCYRRPSWSTSRRPGYIRATAPACCRRSDLARSGAGSRTRLVRRIAAGTRCVGNRQYADGIKDGTVYVLEANPCSTAPSPFVSKAVGRPLAKLATNVMMGKSLPELDSPRSRGRPYISVKESVALLAFPGADVILGPEMRSTGEVMGIDYNQGLAFFKAELSAVILFPGGVSLRLRSG